MAVNSSVTLTGFLRMRLICIVNKWYARYLLCEGAVLTGYTVVVPGRPSTKEGYRATFLGVDCGETHGRRIACGTGMTPWRDLGPDVIETDFSAVGCSRQQAF